MTLCDFQLVSAEPDESGKYAFVCEACGRKVRRRRKNASIDAECPADQPLFGPGTELRPMLHDELGISDDGCRACQVMARRMDRLGVEGVLQRREEFADHLSAAAGKRGWATKLRAAANAVASGLAFRLDRRDLYGSLIDEACRRAVLKNPSTPAGCPSLE